MNLLKKISKSSNDVERLLQKIFESESAEIFGGDGGSRDGVRNDGDGSPTNLAEELGLSEVTTSRVDGEATPDVASATQGVAVNAQPTEGWLETEWGSVQYFIDDQGRMWTGGPTPGGGERWTRHKAGDRGTNGPVMGGIGR